MPKTKDGLTPKQEAFAQHYAVHRNATESYRVAFKPKNCSPKSINELASKMSKNAKVASRIDVLIARKHEKMTAKFDMTIDQLGAELQALGRYDIRDYYSWGKKKTQKTVGKGENQRVIEVEEDYLDAKDSSTLTDLQAKSIVGVELVISETGEKVIKLKHADKRAALVEIGKHLGFYEKDNSQKSQPIVLNFSPDDANLDVWCR